MPMQNNTHPAFIIRDLDKDPHGPLVPAKSVGPHQEQQQQQQDEQQQQLATPGITPDSSPQMTSKVMSRSASDLSAYSLNSNSSISHSRSVSSASQSSRAQTAFPFTNIFKWKRSASGSVGSVSTPAPPSPSEDGFSTTSDYFSRIGQKGGHATNLDNLGTAIETQRADFQANLEAQLLEERRLRHLAEDRLTEVEEEVTRLCTVILPTDSGETGEAYFSTIIDSVRMAIDSYEKRTDGLERQLEEKSTRLTAERRERTAVDIDCIALRNQISALQCQVSEAQESIAAQDRNEELLKQNQELRNQIEQLKLEAPETSYGECAPSPSSETSSSEGSSCIVPAENTDDADSETASSAALLQRIKDTEAQRDALRQVSRGLRQRLTIETRKNADRTRALAAIDRTFAARPPIRPHSRQASVTSVASSETKAHVQKNSLGKINEGLGLGAVHLTARPRFERFVTALEAPSPPMLSV